MDAAVGKHLDRPSQQVGVGVKIVYAMGQVPNSCKTIMFGIFSLFFYTTVIGVPGTLVGIASAIGLVWDAMIDPVIGTLSDNTRGRFGKRHGFMFIGAAGMGLSFWAYFSPPRSLSVGGLFVWLLITNLMVRTMSSLFGIPYYALGAELSCDYHERTSITGIRGAFALLGTLTAAVLSFILFFPATSQGGDPKLNVDGYLTMGLFIGFFMTAVALTSTFGTLSHRQYVSDGESLSCTRAFRRFMGDSLMALQNPSFRVIFVSYSLFFLGIVINGTLAIHFLTYYVNITASESLSVFHLSFYLSALIGVFFWIQSSKFIEKRSLYFIGMLATSMIMACAFLLLGKERIFGTGNLLPLVIGNGIAGFFASILWIIPTSMIADTADQDELFSGRRREGVFFGLFHFGEQIAAGASILVTGVLIDWFVGLVPGQAEQSAMAIERIGILYSLLPAALLVAGSLCILPYTLDQHTVTAIQSRLAKRRALQT